MKISSASLYSIGVAGFLLMAIALWMLPVLFAGFPPYFFDITDIQHFTETGLMTATNRRSLLLYLSVWSWVIDWKDQIGWTLANTTVFAVALLGLWLTVQRIFNTSIAWMSMVFMAFMPMYWTEALTGTGYSLGLFCIFLSALSFVHFGGKSWKAHLVAGVLLGLAIASRDAFVTFIPWVLLVLAWQQKEQWKQAFISLFLFGAGMVIGFLLPLTPNLAAPGVPLHEKIQISYETVTDRQTGFNHLYPDNYTYEFDREHFEQTLTANMEEGSFLDRRAGENYRIIFGLESGLFTSLTNSVWLLANQIPPLFLMETMGGSFLWLLIVPGLIAMWKHHKNWLLFFIGLEVSMEFIIRCILHYRRMHLMNTGWILAIAAGIGALVMANALHKKWPTVSKNVILTAIAVLVSMQLIQTNRQYWAKIYSKSTVPLTRAAAEMFEQLPANSVVVHPGEEELFFDADVEKYAIHPQTVQSLHEREKLHEPFEHYRATHIIGYSNTNTETILSVYPGISVLDMPNTHSRDIPQSRLLHLLLHIVR